MSTFARQARRVDVDNVDQITYIPARPEVRFQCGAIPDSARREETTGLAAVPAVPAPYPVALNVRGRRCVVVGGGGVAERKVRGLLAAGASVTVIAPSLTAGLRALAEQGVIVTAERPYTEG